MVVWPVFMNVHAYNVISRAGAGSANAKTVTSISKVSTSADLRIYLPKNMKCG